MSNLPHGHVLGVDGGGTWTRVVIMRLDGTIVGQGDAGPSNPVSVGVELANSNIIEAVGKARHEAKVKDFKVSRLGLAGATRSRLGEELIELLPSYLGDTGFVSDAHSALAGATGCKPGIVVIAGTGSIVYGVNEKGEEARAGGWGWRLGDEGSGYSIGRSTIIAVLKDHDQSGPRTALKEAVIDYLGLGDVEDIIDWSYDPKRVPSHFASLVPLTKEAEKNGDKAAREIMEDAGKQLGLITQAVIKRLKMADFPVACSGGVFKQPNGYNRAFKETVLGAAQGCVFIEPMFAPTIGSALLALKFLEVEISDELLDNVEKSLRWFDE